MGPLAVIVVLAVLSSFVLAVCYLAAWLLQRWLKPKNRTVRVGLWCVPFAIAAVPLTAFTAGMIWKNNLSPETSYQLVFDQAADSAVSHLRGEASGLTDSQHIFLAFTASGDTLQHVLGSASFSGAADASDLVPLPIARRGVPPWWQAVQCRCRSIYAAEKVRGWDKVVVTNCRDDATIYVEAFWIE